ncbi:MAG: ribosomal 50S subunit-associated protein YjgA (DUF615 family) [Polyangiales bacterium]|jgi:ribosomal 50S subunit-associated protein YjgA (DUF615 family)
MGKSKRPMVDTHTVEEDEEVGPSRTQLRAGRKDDQARREVLAMMLAKLHEPVLLRLKLGEDIEKEVRTLARLSHGSAMSRQRRRVAGSLRVRDLDEVEALITSASDRQKGR